MKTQKITLMICILYALSGWSQVPLYSFFSTAVNGNFANPSVGPFNGLIPLNTSSNWQACFNPPGGNPNLGAWVGAPRVDWDMTTVTPPAGLPQWSWAQDNPAGGANAHGWINYPFYTGPGSDMREHSCVPTATYVGVLDIWFRIDFFMGPNPVLAIDWDIWTDNSLKEIRINNSPPTVFPNNYGGSIAGQQVNFKACKGWLANQWNTIMVHITSGTPTYNCASGREFSGLMIRSNRTLPMTVSGPANVCVNTTNNIFYATPAAGAASYNWATLPFNGLSAVAPINTNQLNLSAALSSVLGPRILTVNALNSAGYCVAAGTVALNVVSTTVMATASSPTMCPGGAVTLSATGNAANYFWIPPVGNIIPGNPIVITTPGTYTLLGLGPCTGTYAITVNLGPTVQPAVSNVTMCSNVPSGTQIGATCSFPGPVTYNWTWPPSGNQSGQYIVVTPQVNTNYVVTATAAGGCPGTAILAATVLTNCCSQGTVPGVTALTTNVIPTGSSFSGQYVINQNTILGNGPGSINLTNAVFMFAPGVQLTIPAGVQVYVNGSHLYGCTSEMWKGIDIQNTGFLQAFYNQNNVTLIEDAETAINIDNPHPTILAIELNGTIFNRNYTSIKVTNSNQPYIPLIVRSCVFTSRSLPFTATSWPTSYINNGGLRQPINATATQNLAVPFDLQTYAPLNLKYPYNSQPANIGIEIRNIANSVGGAPTPGVDVGYTNQVPNGYNLFDNLGIGIDVTDASMSTMNNVFQNMRYFSTPAGMFGGKGIRHKITTSSLMNARLNLAPSGSLYQSTSYGNRFWDCYSAVETENVYDVNIEYNTIRSTQVINYNTPVYLPGSMGIYLVSNRFNYNIQFSEFNNISYGVWANFTSGLYNIGGNAGNGTYASNIIINQNYFGKEVASTLFNPTAYLFDAIHLNGGAAGNWQINGNGFIQSNKIDRAYRGIKVNDMGGFSTNIAGNLINLEDDIMAYAPQYGIEALDMQSGLSIMSNTLNAVSPSNQQVTLVHCRNNMRSFVECNTLSDSYQAFEFEGPNPLTTWSGNKMQNHERGLVLNSNGFIDPQGTNGMTSDNEWNGPWGPPPFSYETFVMNGSNAMASPLTVQPGAPYFPTNHGTLGGTPYNPSCVLINASLPPYICKNQNLPSPPAWKLAGLNTKEINSETLEIFPNPSSGDLTISGLQEKGNSTVTIRDVTGKQLLTKNLEGKTSESLNISSLSNGIYLLEIQSGQNKVIKKISLAK